MRKLITIIIFITVIILITKWWWNSQLSPVSSDKSTKIFVVDRGESFPKIAEDLKKADLIKSSWIFNLYGKQSGLASKIQAGTFRLSKSYSAKEILKALTDQPLDVWITLLEGWRIEEMAKKLNEQLGIDEKEFIKLAVEGYMFPDTYLFPKDYSPQQIAQRLKSTFEQKYSDDLRRKIKSLGLTETQGVVLASIVEREARSQQARVMVASILLKRFKIGMGLNVDATIQYILGYQKDENPPAGGWWKRDLTKDDLTVESPYNTYLHSGFPPSPICNPGLSSLTAVASADPSTPYLYYYHDAKGESHYAKTLEEHNQNVANYP